MRVNYMLHPTIGNNSGEIMNKNWKYTLSIPENLELMIKNEAMQKDISLRSVIIERLFTGYKNDEQYQNHVNRQLTVAEIQDKENENNE